MRGISTAIITAALALSVPASAQDDARLEAALKRLWRSASAFWATAPRYIGQETWREKTYLRPRRKIRAGAKALEPQGPILKTRELLSWYALAANRRAPEALLEFREAISVDGKNVADPAAALRAFRETLRGKNDRRRRKLREDFEDRGVGGAVVDFGQLILLFTKSTQRRYSFSLDGTERSGAEVALRIRYRQRQGNQALHVIEAGKEESAPLEGAILMVESSGNVLAITLNAQRTVDAVKIRDEARVEYIHGPNGVVLPASVTHRRYVGDQLVSDDALTYFGWQPAGP